MCTHRYIHTQPYKIRQEIRLRVKSERWREAKKGEKVWCTSGGTTRQVEDIRETNVHVEYLWIS